MHGKMQEWIVTAVLGLLHARQGGSHITQLGVVLRMLFDPEAGNGFYRFQRLLGQGLVIDRTEKLTTSAWEGENMMSIIVANWR